VFAHRKDGRRGAVFRALSSGGVRAWFFVSVNQVLVCLWARGSIRLAVFRDWQGEKSGFMTPVSDRVEGFGCSPTVS
jgi:hypothetical protein